VGSGADVFLDREEQEDEQRLREVMCQRRSVRVPCHDSPHDEAARPCLRPFHTVSDGAFREVGVELRPKKSLEPSSATRYYGASGKRQPDLTGSRGVEARSHIDVRMSARRAGGASGATGYHLRGCPVVRCGDDLEEREAACRGSRCRCGLWRRNWGRIGSATALQASAGAPGTRTTAAANAQANDGQLVALRPS
jgi:hypothetical protein